MIIDLLLRRKFWVVGSLDILDVFVVAFNHDLAFAVLTLFLLLSLHQCVLHTLIPPGLDLTWCIVICRTYRLR